MNRQPRRFGMGDLMILIAAIGASVWGTRNVWLELTASLGRGLWYSTSTHLIVATTLSACVTPLTLACLAFRLRRPRPDRRRLFIQPGAAALLACSLLLAFKIPEMAASLNAPTVENLSGMRAYPFPVGDSGFLLLEKSARGNGVVGSLSVHECFSVTVASITYPCGYAVATVWLVLALSGRWRPEKSWIDRLGRVLGVIWILITILAAFPL